jgi:hypothetical protein
MNCVTRNMDIRSRVIVNLCFTLSPLFEKGVEVYKDYLSLMVSRFFGTVVSVRCCL